MPSFLENLRLKNIFNLPPGEMVGNDLPSQGGIMGGIPPPRDMFSRFKSPFEGIFGSGMNEDMAPTNNSSMRGGGLNDIASRMQQMYTPETEATNRFNQLIEEYPERNKPGMLRKIASVIAGTVGGPEMFDMSMYGNYNRKVADWKNKITPAQQAANLERQGNVNERTLAYQTISAQLREEAQQAKEENDERRANIAQQRANVYEFRARNPNVKFDFSGPTVKATNPATGEVKDTGISTGAMTELDKLEFQRETTMKAIGERGDEARKTEGERQTGRESLAETRGWKIYNVPDGKGGQKAVKINEVTGEVKELNTPIGKVSTASGGTGGEELPTQTRIRQFNAARELASSRPEFKDFIRIGSPGANDFTVTPPGTGFFGPTGPTKEQYDEIVNAIYGGALGRQLNTDTNTNAPPARARGAAQVMKRTVRNKNTGVTKTQISTDGGKTWKDEVVGK